MTTTALPDVVLFAGPINAAQAPGATVPGAIRHFFVCTGDGSTPPICSSILQADTSGRYLPNLLKRIGLDESRVGRVFLGSFSAGGQVWKRLLMNPQDRARITGAVLGDSAYESVPGSSAIPVAGFVEYALEVMRDPTKFFFASVSSNANPSTSQPGVIWASGSQTLAATRAAVEQRSGRSFKTGGTLPVSVQPDALYSIGSNLLFADFGQASMIGPDGKPTGAHGFHAFMQPEFWQRILVPWLQSGGSTVGDWWQSAVAFLVGSALGYGGAARFR